MILAAILSHSIKLKPVCHTSVNSYLRSSSSWFSSSTLSLSAASTKARNWSILASIFNRHWTRKIKIGGKAIKRDSNSNLGSTGGCKVSLLNYWVTWPAPDLPWAGSFLAPSLQHGQWPWRPQLSPCPSLPSAAQYAAASPSAPPAKPWCLKSYDYTATMSLLAMERQNTSKVRLMSKHSVSTTF